VDIYTHTHKAEVKYINSRNGLPLECDRIHMKGSIETVTGNEGSIVT
jgi:hypothetical protein